MSVGLHQWRRPTAAATRAVTTIGAATSVAARTTRKHWRKCGLSLTVTHPLETPRRWSSTPGGTRLTEATGGRGRPLGSENDVGVETRGLLVNEVKRGNKAVELDSRVMDAESRSQVMGSQKADAHDLDSQVQRQVLGEDDGKGVKDVSRGSVEADVEPYLFGLEHANEGSNYSMNNSQVKDDMARPPGRENDSMPENKEDATVSLEKPSDSVDAERTVSFYDSYRGALEPSFHPATTSDSSVFTLKTLQSKFKLASDQIKSKYDSEYDHFITNFGSKWQALVGKEAATDAKEQDMEAEVPEVTRLTAASVPKSRKRALFTKASTHQHSASPRPAHPPSEAEIAEDKVASLLSDYQRYQKLLSNQLKELWSSSSGSSTTSKVSASSDVSTLSSSSAQINSIQKLLNIQSSALETYSKLQDQIRCASLE